MLINRIKGKRQESIDRDCLMVGNGEQKKCIDTADQVGDALRDHFASWFREGHDSWYQMWENGRVVFTHPLFRNDDAGMQMRQEVVDGSSERPECPDFRRWLQTEVYPDIP